MKKLLIILIIGFAGIAYAAPSYQQTSSLRPYDAGRDVGTSTAPYGGGTFDQLCLTGDTCRTTWPTSGSFSWPFTKQADSSQGTTTIMSLLGGFYSSASSTIGANTTASGLTIFGGATTTGEALFLSSTTLQDFTAINGTTTNATTTTAHSGSFTSTGSLKLETTGTTPIYLGVGPSAGYSGLWVTTAARTFQNYTLLVDTGGTAIHNVPTGASFSFRINNGEILSLTSSGLTLTGGATNLSGVGNLTVATLTTSGTGPVSTKYLVDLGNNDGFIDTDVGSGRAWQYENRTSSEVGFTFKAASGQTANILEIASSSGSILASITPTGDIGIGTTSPYSKLGISSFNGSGNSLFTIASSTGSGATTTLFEVSGRGGAAIGRSTAPANGLLGGAYNFQEIYAPAGKDSVLIFADDDVNTGIVACAANNYWGFFDAVSSTAGGFDGLGCGEGVGTIGIRLLGIMGSTNPTDSVPATRIAGLKIDGGGNLAALGALETVFDVSANFSTGAITLLGDGNFGVGSTSPGFDFVVGNSGINSGGTTFTNTSSRDIKNSIMETPIPTDYLEKFMAVKVKNFRYDLDYLVDTSGEKPFNDVCYKGICQRMANPMYQELVRKSQETRTGFIAEEFGTLLGQTNKKTISGDEIMQAMWQAIQEQQKVIEGLETRVEALESGRAVLGGKPGFWEKINPF